MVLLLNRYPDGVIGYWHDLGYAETLARLGFDPLSAWLGSLGARMLGIHPHDIRGFQDHRGAGIGEMDFTPIRPRIPDSALRVCEFDQSQSPQKVIQGLAHLRQAGLVP